jgi:hypothetical protein
MSQMPQTMERRPGLVTFAAIMMFLLAGFALTFALVEFWNAVWVGLNTYVTFGWNLWLWGIVDAVIAVIAFFAGVDILRGGPFGQIAGIVIAALSAIRWFVYLPAAPWLAAVIIVVDVLIIYGLVAHSEYFTGSREPGMM